MACYEPQHFLRTFGSVLGSRRIGSNPRGLDLRFSQDGAIQLTPLTEYLPVVPLSAAQLAPAANPPRRWGAFFTERMLKA